MDVRRLGGQYTQRTQGPGGGLELPGLPGRRQFVDIEAFFPSECARVIDAIATIYKHEAHCKDQQLTPAQRLAYHQEHSREVMGELKT
jgi:hypothetical protein